MMTAEEFHSRLRTQVAWRVHVRMVCALLILASLCLAQTPQQSLDKLLDSAKLPGTVERSALGVTRKETIIPALITAGDLDYNSPKTRILLVGGLDGTTGSVTDTLAAVRWFYGDSEAAALRQRFAVSAAPVANPDGWAQGTGELNGSGGHPIAGYPPTGDAYNSPADPEAAYLWRWIGLHAPDLVVDVRSVSGVRDRRWFVPADGPAGLQTLANKLGATVSIPVSGELVSALARATPSNTGSVPALRLQLPANSPFLPELLKAIEASGFEGPSVARVEIQKRIARTPLEISRQLATYYGHALDRVEYIPAVALIGRLRLGKLTSDRSQLEGVERIVAPYVRGEKPALTDKPSGSDFSGHLVFGELAKLTGNPAYVELVRRVANLGFDAQGAPLEAMPEHSEMSDAVFMACPILAQAGRLTGEKKYYDMAARHMRFMLKLNLRPDGLHQHSPLDRAAWGRGNGFPALGLALTLNELPEDYPARREVLAALRAHLAALQPYQDASGMWHQVIDFPGSYRELTATAMITYAMARGVRMGWLEEAKYRPAIERAWYGLRARIAPDGGLVDVCTGTGKQPNFRAYLDRTAILGKDPRGGAMALLVATEMVEWERWRQTQSKSP